MQSRRLRQRGADKREIHPNSGSLRRAWFLLGAGVGRTSRAESPMRSEHLPGQSTRVNPCSCLQDCSLWRMHLWRKASSPHMPDKCGLHVSTVRKCLSALSYSVREQMLVAKLTPAWGHRKHCCGTALGSPSGSCVKCQGGCWEWRCLSARLGLLRLQSLLALFVAMCSQMQGWRALSARPLEGFPANTEPDSVSQISWFRAKFGSR